MLLRGSAVSMVASGLILLLFLSRVTSSAPGLAPLNTSALPAWARGTLGASLMEQACFNAADRESCNARLHAACQEEHQLPPAAPPAEAPTSNVVGGHGPFSVIHAAIRVTINEALEAIDMVSRFTAMSANFREEAAIQDCMELLDYSVEELALSLAEMRRVQTGHIRTPHREANLGAWLSAALGNQDTCLEGFEGTDGRLKHYIKGGLTQVSQLVTNVMGMYKRMSTIVPLHHPHQNETRNGNDELRNGFPAWGMSDDDQRMVKMSPQAMHVDATVAQDGSGTHRSVMEAVNAAPDHGNRRYVIYVKKGVYRENVEIKKKKTNIMLVGDGIGVTVITGDRSFDGGWTTFRSATFAVSGQGFIARDITFRNTAGPSNHQAVALRVDSDRSAFYRCSMEGYQDTLYAHSLRQFYRDCHIYGTIDFIFGNGAAVLQHCKIFTRKPLPYQKVTITAQGRKDPSQSTGFSIQNSLVYATYPTYLGRPWKMYSRTVFMQCYLSSQVQPRGWLEWAGDFALGTLYYGEYRNYGPGAELSGRVRWPGYHVLRDAGTAAAFTVRRFIDGVSWLPSTGVLFSADLF